MIRGIYTATAALRAAAIQQNRVAHNLANLETTAFKQVLTVRQAYEAQQLGQFDEHYELRRPGVGPLENGLLVPEEIIDFSPGTMKLTDRPLDLAIWGEGFFRVQTPEGERLTRDGSFHRDSAGNLVTRDGFSLLDQDGQPITLPPGIINVGRNGALFVDGEFAAQLGIATAPNPEQLVPDDNNLFQIDESQALPPEEIHILQGYLEGSNVDESTQVVEMMRILRLYEANQKTIQTQDRLLVELLSVGEVS